ncbi:MAG: hypothetical protein II534_05895 [Clostridia bacterium]|nr:hypothetical protein [Clostridia bacterium]
MEEKEKEKRIETETETEREKEKGTEPVRGTEAEAENEAEARNSRRKRSPLSLIEKVRAYLARHYIPEAAEEAAEDATADPTADQTAFAAPLPSQAGIMPSERGRKKKKPRMAAAGSFGKKRGAKKDAAEIAEFYACSAEAAENRADRDAGRLKEAFIAPDAVQAVPPHPGRDGASGVPAGMRPAPESGREDEIRRIIEEIDEGFALKLMRLIDRRGMDDVTCYKKAGVSRQTWYKIMNDGDYRPGKKTVLAFAFALELSYEETQALLGSVGLTLSRSSKFDVIVEYFLKARNYDTAALDDVLFSFDQETLMSVGL